MDFLKFAEQMQIGINICTSKAQKLFLFLSTQDVLKNCTFGSMPSHYCFSFGIPTKNGLYNISCSIVPHLEAH